MGIFRSVNEAFMQTEDSNLKSGGNLAIENLNVFVSGTHQFPDQEAQNFSKMDNTGTASGSNQTHST